MSDTSIPSIATNATDSSTMASSQQTQSLHHLHDNAQLSSQNFTKDEPPSLIYNIGDEGGGGDTITPIGVDDEAAALVDTDSSHNDIIDWSTFGQILEMDEDEEERDFSRGIVVNFFEQAEATFGQMESALQEKNLGELSALGHFLKGSSAALGLTKVKNSCEKIQHFGAGKDETGSTDVNDDQLCLDRIKSTLESVRLEYAESRTYLRNYFGDL